VPRRPIPNYTAQLGSGIRGLRIGVIHHFHETDHKVSEGTQRGITAAIAIFRDLGAEISEVQLSPLQDWLACGSLISITERAAAYEEWARTRLGEFSEGAQSAHARRFCHRRRLCSGSAAPPRAACRIAVGDEGPRRGANRYTTGRGGKNRRSAEMGFVRGPQLYDAVQRERLPGDFGVRWFRRGGFAGGDPAGRQAVPGTDIIPRRRRLREGNPVPRSPPGDRRRLSSEPELALCKLGAGVSSCASFLDNTRGGCPDRFGAKVSAQFRVRSGYAIVPSRLDALVARNSDRWEV